MAEWLYEDGIGEARAALVADDAILAARIELPDTLRVGTVARARLTERTVATLDDGREVLLDRAPAGVTLGATLTVEVVREAIPEPGRAKRARGRASDAAPTTGLDLLARITASPHPVRILRAHEADALEAAGWSEVLEEARTGEIAFPGGALRLSPTPAMTLFDVDGEGAIEQLAIRAATAVALAIRRHGIGGSIGVDFPSVTGKALRQEVAAALDAALPAPFERTAVNGFGFLQIVRPRPRASLPERVRDDPVGAAARAALRLIERTPPTAPNRFRLPDAVRDHIESRGDWIEALVRRAGRAPIFDR
ncbi:ribonuclease E/G [Sphingomonas endophytica]|uniref:Ribonuclease n=1 Tax=Sphingomonas endophytica TaxID=869719 RepID=A0A147I6N0_9SPHN|nr:ribonuclease E/G [Sphingomonas endophytica]KTT74623.1 ribonuclease [Sphingomonas endophytica]